MVEAAPAVVFGFGDEASRDGVAVDVLDFFFEFAGGEDVGGYSVRARKRLARSANAHLSDDETVAKMGHPDFVG